MIAYYMKTPAIVNREINPPKMAGGVAGERPCDLAKMNFHRLCCATSAVHDTI